MADRDDSDELHPSVVPIPDGDERSMDDWLASLRRHEPIELPISAADLVAQTRAEDDGPT